MSTGTTGPVVFYNTLPNLSILYYNTKLIPPSNNLIDYLNISITYSARGYRIWSFTFGGTITSPVITQVFQFGNLCVPSIIEGFPCIPINQINFNPPFQGTILVNQQMILINDPKDTIASFGWNAEQAQFELTLNLCGYVEETTPNSLYATLTLKDCSNCLGFDCPLSGNCGCACVDIFESKCTCCECFPIE